MKKESKKERSADDLRRRAEAKVEKIIGSEAEFLAKDPVVLIHELKVHQVELEMQNEELRRSQHENEELRVLYQDLYDFAPMGYVTLDPKGRIVKSNLSAEMFLGMGRQQLLKLPFMAFISKESLTDYKLFFQALLSAVTPEKCEVGLRVKDGSEYRVILEGTVIASSAQQEKQLSLVMIDVTAQRRVEELLRHYSSELGKKVAERTAELREKDRLLIAQSRQAAMGELLVNISHQWRQPLNALGLIVQTLPLVLETGELTPKYVDEYEKKAMNIINHMSQTINDFKNFYRTDKERKVFKVSKVVDSTMALIGESFRDKSIVIERVTKEDRAIEGYPSEYGQVLLNILLNARDALESQERARRKVSISIDSKRGRSVVTIRDNAGGIPESIIDRIFDPYFTTKDPDKGTGIGLFMSKSIIEKNMGGSLTVRNVEGGAEFRIEV